MEEEEEEDRNSCCWVLEQASPRQIFWYLKLFDRCSTLLWQSYSLLPEEERGDQTTERRQLGFETQPRQAHTRARCHAPKLVQAPVCALVRGRFPRTTTWADVGLCVGTVWLNLRQIQEHIVYPLPPFTSLFSLSADVDEDSWAASVGVFPLKLHATVDYMKSIRTG